MGILNILITYLHISVHKSVDAGRTVKNVCREAGILEACYYNWKAKYGWMETFDIKRLKEFEDENRRLKPCKTIIRHLNMCHIHIWKYLACF